MIPKYKCTGAFLLSCLLFSAACMSAVPEKGNSPKLFQVTTAETRPGDAVLVRGEYLDKVSAVKVYRLPDENVNNELPSYIPEIHEDALEQQATDRKVEALTKGNGESVSLLQQKSQSLKFIVPKEYKEGVYSVELIQPDNRKISFYVNVPRVDWAISEEGLKATAGDYLRIQGKNLLRVRDAAQAILISTQGNQVVRARVNKAFDDFSVSVDIPENTPVGDYNLYYHNGLGGKTAWSEPLKIEVVHKSPDWWGTKTFNVKDFGALGNGQHNETAAFRAALNAAGENGGGIVYVPRGRYMLTGELILSPNTLLKGESKELTQIFWNSLNWDTNELPNSLVSGTHHFALKDLNMFASRAWGVILSTGPLQEQGHIILENLIVSQTAQLSGMVYQVKSNRDVVDQELNTRWTKTGIILRGEGLKVRDCVFNSSGMYTFYAVSGFIQNCHFDRHNTGVNQPYMLIHPKGLIFEDCLKQGDGYGYASSIDESRNMYEARNVIPFNYTNDREVMTLDGGSGAYNGKIAKIEGQTIMLPEGAVTNQWTENKWVGGGVFIVEGKGTGQYRRITKHTLKEIELDQPFLVNPDETSVISITTIRKNLFFINNEATDCGAYQFYGSAQNGVISGLKLKRTNGIVSRGSYIYQGKQPNWYIDIVNCKFTEGNYTHWFGVNDRGHSGYQSINLVGSGGSGLNIGTLIRHNDLADFSYIRTSPGANPDAVTDVVIEDNNFRIAKTAISLGGSASQTSNVLIHNNHYEEVDSRLETPSRLDKNSYLVLEDGVSSLQRK